MCQGFPSKKSSIVPVFSQKILKRKRFDFYELSELDGMVFTQVEGGSQLCRMLDESSSIKMEDMCKTDNEGNKTENELEQPM